MNLTVSGTWRMLNTPIPNPLAYWFQNVFAPKMPRHWKRALYIASIIAMTSFTDKPDFLLFEKINDLLKMTYRGQSYLIPKFMRNMIWKQILKEQIELDGKAVAATAIDQFQISDEELDTICKYFSDRTPKWIIYETPSKMQQDLKKCLTMLFSRRFNTQF